MERNEKSTNCQPYSEVSDGVLRTVLSRYGEVRDVHVETWSRLFRYPVANGIRLALVTITKHIPSHITGWQQSAGVIRMTAYDVLWL